MLLSLFMYSFIFVFIYLLICLFNQHFFSILSFPFRARWGSGRCFRAWNSSLVAVSAAFGSKAVTEVAVWPWVITYASILGRMNTHVPPIF